MKDTDPHLENRGKKHKNVPETEDEDGYRFEERTSFEKQYDEPNSNEYEYEPNFAEPDPPHSDQAEIDHRGVPIAISKHNNLFQVITPMVFTSKGKYTTAYNTLSTDMDEMQVSDLE